MESSDEHGTRVGGFRLGPPKVGRELMIRPRLLDALKERFRSRLALVMAGPGFGKTSLLTQARAENLLAPRGADVWLTCHIGDGAVSTLAEGLAAALQRPAPPTWDLEEAVDRIVGEVWRRSPEQVVLLLDDAHLVPPGSPGADLLAALLDRLPNNGHLVLAGRDPLPVGGARLAAMGQLIELGESDLAFSETEQAEFAALRKVPTELLRDSGGWPALAELTTSTGDHRVLDYLWEELLAGMSSQRRRLLALLSLVGGGDDEVAATLTDGPVDLSELLAGLPLVTGAPGSWHSLHPLWGPALARELSAPERAVARVRAAGVMRARGDVDAAVRQLVGAGAWDAVREMICETGMMTHPLVAPDVLAEWYELLPAEHRCAAEGRLLLALVERSTNLPSARVMFEAAEGDFRTSGNVTGELAALTHVCHISWWLDDADRLEAAVARADALAAQLPVLRLRINVARAWLADLRADWDGAFELLSTLPSDAVSAPMAAGLEAQRAWVLLVRGDPGQARPYAEQAVTCASGTYCSLAVNMRLLAAWLSGSVEEATQDVAVLAAATSAAGGALGHVFEKSQCALVLAYIGELAAARSHLAAARVALTDESSVLTKISYLLAEVAVLVAEGDEEQAGAMLTAELATRSLAHAGLTRLHRLFPALSYVLVPESRTHWHAAALAPALRTMRDVAAALVAARERESLRELAALDFPEPGRVRATLPLPWAVEFAVAAIAAGRAEGRRLLAALDTAARPHLKALASNRSGRLARAARELAMALPPTPSEHLDLLVLGPLELRRAGTPVDHPSLQRGRVRQLLLFMVTHGSASRHAVAAKLWPDLDHDAAAHNLRVTLNYTQQLLEPDRDTGDPPFFLRSENDTLRLTGEEWLSVDAWRFDRLLDEAAVAERQGAPSLALRAYQEALPLYRGDYLADVPYAEWATVERDRLRVRYVIAAVRAGELLLATGDHDLSLTLGHAALRVDQSAESAYRLLIAAHLERGELDAARRVMDRCKRMLVDLGAPPDRQTQSIARRLRTT